MIPPRLFVALGAGLLLATSAAHAAVFANLSPISIPDSGTASPYPSTISVIGSGPILDITVKLNNINHTFSGDVGILLVGPTGIHVVLAGLVGGGSGAVNDTITFDQDFTAITSLSNSGTFAPGGFSSLAFNSPAPTGPHSLNLDDFLGTNANGDWKLYVQDFAAADVGNIGGGWSLDITTAPPNITTVPEPGSALGTLLLIGSGCLLRRRKNR